MNLKYALLLFVILLFPGCSNAPTGVNVSGQVTLDGTAIENGMIIFIPEAGKVTGIPTSAAIEQGVYSANFVPIGKVRVTFAATRLTGKTEKIYSEEIALEESIIPAKYDEGQVLEISEDTTQDFSLTSTED